jgi:formylglycine-generating enzyme required for sulfatase activity
MAQLTLTYHKATAQYFTEDLGNNIGLDMVLIPDGTFLMGSPEDELERTDAEGPQHEVTVPTFFMGRFPITQAQWRAVAQLEQVDRVLNSDPSYFKSDPSHVNGDNRPVEQVSWYDAMEFCDRLSKFTGRDYRLPSEAEWEYACRAGTTTPFHFGETITTDLANYDGTDGDDGRWKGNYGQGPKGIYRRETTEVGSFPPNAFGLQDMHGNVWEWCQDHGHDNYQGAPTDGSAWLFSDEKKDEDSRTRMLRGGSWIPYPRDCRSAFRLNYNPDARLYNFGFRVVCSAARALL